MHIPKRISGIQIWFRNIGVSFKEKKQPKKKINKITKSSRSSLKLASTSVAFGQKRKIFVLDV